MSLGHLVLFIASAVLVLAIIVSGSVNEQLFKVPLFEAGSVWYREMGAKIYSTVSRLLVPNFASPWTYVIGGVMVVGGYYLYRIFITPVNRVKMLGDVGYIPEGKLTMKDMANIVRQRRLTGDCPPVYPNGWFAILESRDIKRGESKTVSCLGE